MHGCCSRIVESNREKFCRPCPSGSSSPLLLADLNNTRQRTPAPRHLTRNGKCRRAAGAGGPEARHHPHPSCPHPTHGPLLLRAGGRGRARPRPAAGDETAAPCRFGWACTREGCWYAHPHGREVDGDPHPIAAQAADLRGSDDAAAARAPHSPPPASCSRLKVVMDGRRGAV